MITFMGRAIDLLLHVLHSGHLQLLKAITPN